jgi:hypothetical protein
MLLARVVERRVELLGHLVGDGRERFERVALAVLAGAVEALLDRVLVVAVDVLGELPGRG